MIRRPPRSTRTDTLFPYTTLFRSVFISSPGSITPYHFDPEHNILLQLRGTKVMNVWPAGDERFAPRPQHERYHTGGHRNLPWQDAFAGGQQRVPRSEKRHVGKECVSTCRSRWWPYLKKKKK